MKALIRFIKERNIVTREHTKKMLRISAISLLVVVFLFGILAGSLLTYSYSKIENARVSILDSISAWRNFDLTRAASSLEIGEQQLAKLKAITDRAGFWVRVPVLGKRVLAADTMVESSLDALRSYENIIRVTGALAPYRNTPYDEITNRTELTAALGEMIDALEQVYINVQQMLATTHELGISDIAIVERFADEFARFQPDDFMLLRLMHNVVSKRGEQNFLLLMQNNTELRPTGGYIGNMGILTLRDGDLPRFELKDTDYLNEDIDIKNIYRDREIVTPRQLDTRVEKTNITPPPPLARFFPQYEWRFGDANWSPSFPETAHNAMTLYNSEVTRLGEETTTFDGVIALNPELVNDWLRIVGDVHITLTNDETYTADNFADTPQNLYPGDVLNGRAITEKTYLVDAIAQEVRAKMTGASLRLLLDTINTLRHNLADSNVLFYFNDPVLQSELARYGWSGELRHSDEDYLYVVDANLSRLRLDHLVSRQIDYRVNEIDGTYIAQANITYKYNAGEEYVDGLFAEVIGTYETYVRIYAPAGASLIGYEGAADVDVFTEAGKTTFGAFVSVAPNTTHAITLTYALPFIQTDDDYELLLQKQPGNEFTAFRVSLPLVDGATDFSPAKPQRNDSEGTVLWQGLLDEDQKFVVR